MADLSPILDEIRSTIDALVVVDRLQNTTTSFRILDLVGGLRNAPGGDLHMGVNVDAPSTINTQRGSDGGGSLVDDAVVVELALCVKVDDQPLTKEEGRLHEKAIRRAVTSLRTDGSWVALQRVDRGPSRSLEWWLVTQTFRVRRFAEAGPLGGC